MQRGEQTGAIVSAAWCYLRHSNWVSVVSWRQTVLIFSHENTKDSNSSVCRLPRLTHGTGGLRQPCFGLVKQLIKVGPWWTGNSHWSVWKTSTINWIDMDSLTDDSEKELPANHSLQRLPLLPWGKHPGLNQDVSSPYHSKRLVRTVLIFTESMRRQ